MRNLNGLDWVSLILLMVGGINWGLIGFFGFDLVASIFGADTIVSRIIYALVGLSALYVAVLSPALGRRAREYGAPATGRPAAQH